MNIKKTECNEEKDTSKDKCERELQFISKSERSPCQHQDPLKWFGILVPQNLKQAQTAFKEGECYTMEVKTNTVICNPVFIYFFNQQNS